MYGNNGCSAEIIVQNSLSNSCNNRFLVQFLSSFKSYLTNRGRSTKKVLIVDDNPDIQDVVSEIVSGSGYIPLKASGGKEALEKAASEHPDLILLDISMEDMDGWSVCT